MIESLNHFYQSIWTWISVREVSTKNEEILLYLAERTVTFPSEYAIPESSFFNDISRKQKLYHILVP
jgi:hypothetical protein